MKKHRLAGLIGLCLCCMVPTSLRAAEPEQSQWNADEGHIYQYLKECVDRHQAVPTMEQMASLPGGTLGPKARARLSARLYHEYGIIGALLSEDEYRIVDYIFHQQRKLGQAHDLAVRIRSALGGDLTILRIRDALSFLREAGYVDIRREEGEVYLVIPRGQTTLHPAVRMEWQTASASVQTSPYHWQDHPRQDIESSPPKSGDSPRIEIPQTPPGLSNPVLHISGALPEVTRATGVCNPKPALPDQDQARPVSPSDSGTVTPAFTRASPPHSDRGGRGGPGREERQVSGAPNQQNWLFLFGQSTYDLRAITSDTYEDVFLSVRDGRLASCLPPDVIVFNGGEPDHIYFFRTMENLRLWREDHAHIRGKVMTLPETLLWARNRH